MKKISFVIPCYRSENTIAGVVNEIEKTVGTSYTYEIILVNDCSPDNTYCVIKKLASENLHVRGINLLKNFGQASAIMAGLHHTTGDIIVCLDDDGQSPVDGLPLMLQKIEDGYDLVYADYYEKKGSSFRLFGSKMNELMMNVLLNKPKDIIVNSFFACTRVVVNEVLNYKSAFPYLPGLMLRTTRNMVNVKVNHRERLEGESGYTLAKLLGLWLNGFTSFSVKPLRIAALIGVFFSFLGFLFLAVVIGRKLLDPTIQIGWTSLISITMFFDGLILIVLGLVGEYVGRIYLCINSTPQFVIRETVGFDSLENNK